MGKRIKCPRCDPPVRYLCMLCQGNGDVLPEDAAAFTLKRLDDHSTSPSNAQEGQGPGIVDLRDRPEQRHGEFEGLEVKLSLDRRKRIAAFQHVHGERYRGRNWPGAYYDKGWVKCAHCGLALPDDGTQARFHGPDLPYSAAMIRVVCPKCIPEEHLRARKVLETQAADKAAQTLKWLNFPD